MMIGLHENITETDKDAVTAFFRAEYMIDVTVAEVDKPVIALADGLVIGGGAGLAQACRYVVISEVTRLVDVSLVMVDDVLAITGLPVLR